MLVNIETGLTEAITEFNKKKPLDFAESTKKSFKSSFVKQGEYKKPSKSAQPEARGHLSYANDWRMLVDYEEKRMVFPPVICATNLRPDIVIWSKLSRVVLLMELTVCAEEGIDAAQLRKESKYTHLLEEINEAKCWRAQLFTLEIGARGLVSSRAYGTFTKLGLTGRSAKKLCKGLSTVAARCSYAIYLAHNNRVWCRSDLVTLPVNSRVTGIEDEPEKKWSSFSEHIASTPGPFHRPLVKPESLSFCNPTPFFISLGQTPLSSPTITTPTPSGTLPVYACVTGIEKNPDPAIQREHPRTNLSILQANGVKTLFHFTDVTNLASIRANGLMSASNLLESKINSKMNSDELSRHLDKSLGLENFVRLSFNDKNPMMFVALKQERVSDLVFFKARSVKT